MKRLFTIISLALFLGGCTSQEAKLVKAYENKEADYLIKIVAKSTQHWQVEDAAYYLGRGGYKNSLPTLLNRLTDRALHPRARGEIAMSIALLGDDSIVPNLISALEYAQEDDERCRIINALGHHCTNEAIAALQQQAADSQIMVSRIATATIIDCRSK